MPTNVDHTGLLLTIGILLVVYLDRIVDMFLALFDRYTVLTLLSTIKYLNIIHSKFTEFILFLGVVTIGSRVITAVWFTYEILVSTIYSTIGEVREPPAATPQLVLDIEQTSFDDVQHFIDSKVTRMPQGNDNFLERERRYKT